MSLLKVAKAFSREDEHKQRQDELQQEAERLDLAGNGGFLTVAKYVIYTVLGALNFRLFFTVVQGAWGVAIGFTAILSECFAIYCWNQQHKSSGRHRSALQFFSVAFTVVSVIHGAASLYEMTGIGPSIGRPLYWYSHAIAFPLIFGLMIVALFVLGFTHWSAKVAKARAEAQVSIAEDRASLLTRTAILKNETTLANAELEHFKEKLRVEQEMTALLEDVARIEQRKQAAVNNITDPSVRDRLQRLLGIVAPPVAQPTSKTITMAPATGATKSTNFAEAPDPKSQHDRE